MVTTTPQFTEPSGASKTFSLHLNGGNYDYVMNYARVHDVTRNRAINLIIEAHAAEEARKAKRASRNGPKS